MPKLGRLCKEVKTIDNVKTIYLSVRSYIHPNQKRNCFRTHNQCLILFSISGFKPG